MKRRNFLRWCASALVAAREAWASFMEPSEPPPPQPTSGTYDLSYNGEIVGRGTWNQGKVKITDSKQRDS